MFASEFLEHCVLTYTYIVYASNATCLRQQSLTLLPP